MKTHAHEGDLAGFLARCEGQIRERGCVTVWIPFDSKTHTSAFAYTVGLNERFKRPELLVFGFDQDESLMLIDSLLRRYVRAGFDIPVNQPISRVLQEASVVAKVVVPLRAVNYARWAIERCGQLHMPCQVLQIVVPDPRGRFPWESGYDTRWDEVQPRLFE